MLVDCWTKSMFSPLDAGTGSELHRVVFADAEDANLVLVGKALLGGENLRHSGQRRRQGLGRGVIRDCRSRSHDACVRGLCSRLLDGGRRQSCLLDRDWSGWGKVRALSFMSEPVLCSLGPN